MCIRDRLLSIHNPCSARARKPIPCFFHSSSITARSVCRAGDNKCDDDNDDDDDDDDDDKAAATPSWLCCC